MNRIRIALALSAATIAALAAQSAQAAKIVGLTTSNQLVTFDSNNPGAILSTSPAISGLAAGDSIADIDAYPVNGIMHGIGAVSGNLYRIDVLTGVAILDVAPQSPLGGPTDADFNPAADRLRVFSANDANFRMTPSVNTAGPTGASAGLVTNDGVFAYASGSANPNLVANAYNNNFDGTATTSLFSIDADLDILVLHSGAPQFSVLNGVGPLGFNVGQNVGFDITFANDAYVSNDNFFYSIDLAGGALAPIGIIGTPVGGPGVRTIAVIPEPATIGLLALAAVTAIRRR